MPNNTTIKLDLNDQFVSALSLMEQGNKNIFITGKAGTGKSTLLNHFKNNSNKKIALLAPTGVAAVNIKGQTIHSFFRFKPNVTLQSIKPKNFDPEKGNIYQKLDTIVIDEISMVRADLLDCIDKFLRLNGKAPSQPFGGIQVIFIGDLYQLPPVVPRQEKEIFHSHYKTPYFFSSHCFEELAMEYIELDKIYRQSDAHFIKLLNSIRNNTATDYEIREINKRYDQCFEPTRDDFYMYLTPTNSNAETINTKLLNRTKGKEHIFHGEISGEFGKEYLPTLVDLQVKIGAQIMMLNNDSEGRWINGTIGKIIGVENLTGKAKIIAKLETGQNVSISPYKWELYNFYLDGMDLKSKVIGTFTQYPLMLAWAVTIHKSQGKTFDKVILDIDRGTFAHGQMYVALSRCRTLDGLILKKEIAKKHIWMDYNVVQFITRYQYKKSAESTSTEDKIVIIKNAIVKQYTIDIVCLKANDEKNTRSIQPKKVGEMEYKGKIYIALEGFCLSRQENRVFRVDRILDVKYKLC
jgi:ATP-dependent exoDNAse (exonuclease V) alpha subunit